MKVAYRIVKRSIGRRTRQYSSVDAAAQNRTRGQSGERRSRTEDQGGHVHPARMQSVITQRWHSFPAVILSYCRESYSVGQGFLGEGRSIEYEPPPTHSQETEGPSRSPLFRDSCRWSPAKSSSQTALSANNRGNASGIRGKPRSNER